MNKFLFALFFILPCSAGIFSQNSTPTPTPVPADNSDIVRISTNLIQIDATVTDKNGKIVRDLRPEEFEIYQNGKKQEISNFSFISSTREISERGSSIGGKAGINNVPPSTPVRAENVKRTIALVVDDLNLSFQSTNQVQQALRKFVDQEMQAGDLVAIIRTGAGIGALQQFTNDKRQLYAAIDRVRYNAVGTGNVGSFEPLQGKNAIEASMPISPDAQNAAFNEFRASIYATGTLGALNFVVRGMADLPGRKSIMLMSDGFALYTQDDQGTRDSSRVIDGIKFLVDKATRASVVVYALDPRGLVYTGLSAQDNAKGRSSAELRQVESDRVDQIAETQEGLKYLAEETGGYAIVNNNDVSAGIKRILDDQSYYLLGYLPEDDTFDPKLTRYNDLVIKVLRPGTTVRYRGGFLGISEEKQAKPTKKTTVDRLQAALTSPFAVNDIFLRLNSLFGNNARDGSYLRSLIHIRSDDVTFVDTPDGGKKANFDILAVIFGENGTAIEQISKSLSVTLKKDVYEDFLRTGFVYDFVFPVKKPGAYQLRIVFQDRKSEKVGSANQFIEVPDLKKNRLTLSGVALESVPLRVWQKRTASIGKGPLKGDFSSVLGDTAVRQFRRGTVLNYGLSIYNAKALKGQPPRIFSQIKLYYDGKPVFEGKVLPIAGGRETDPKLVNFMSSLTLGTEMSIGDYVMEIIVTDDGAKEKERSAVQYVQFEIVE